MTKDNDIRWVSKVFDEVSSYCSIGDLEDVLKKARSAEVLGEWKDFHIRCEDTYDGISVRLIGLKLENHTERKYRLEKEARRVAVKELQDAAEFERLKKKFEAPPPAVNEK